MKYGVLDYVSRKSTNLGDYIQSLSALELLPIGTDEVLLLDRDDFSTCPKEGFKIIMNGWWKITKKNCVVPKNVTPLFVSYHVDSIDDDALNWYVEDLKKYEPIGCRDYATVTMLRGLGVKAYFSGCLTLTIKPRDTETKGGLALVDLDEVPRYIDLSRYQVELRHHFVEPSKPFAELMNEADAMLRYYCSKDVVISSRLHSVLPCLAMGTTVVFKPKSYDGKRFLGLSTLLNYDGEDNGKRVCNLCITDDGGIINRADHVAIAEELRRTVAEFVK